MRKITAMILAGGQGTRLGVLTEKIAKPAVPFGGKYRLIDFTLSNCVNSGIYKIGVLTQSRLRSDTLRRPCLCHGLQRSSGFSHLERS